MAEAEHQPAPDHLERFAQARGSWVTVAFFLAGLLLGYRNPAITRLRYFLLGCVVVLALAQALGRTQLSEESPDINSENLLVLLAPLVLVYGVGLFYVLLSNPSALPHLRYIIVGIFSLVACLLMLFASCRPRPSPWSICPTTRPPSRPSPGWLKEKEMAMSDIPWAMVVVRPARMCLADVEVQTRLEGHDHA